MYRPRPLPTLFFIVVFRHQKNHCLVLKRLRKTVLDPSTLGEALLSRLEFYSADLPEGVMFQEFISVDSQVNTTATLTTEDIVATVKLNNEDHDMDAENEEDISNSQLPFLPPTIRECEKGLETVKRFFEVRQSAEHQLSIISDLEFSLAEIATILYKQSTIIDYTHIHGQNVTFLLQCVYTV